MESDSSRQAKKRFLFLRLQSLKSAENFATEDFAKSVLQEMQASTVEDVLAKYKATKIASDVPAK